MNKKHLPKVSHRMLENLGLVARIVVRTPGYVALRRDKLRSAYLANFDNAPQAQKAFLAMIGDVEVDKLDEPSRACYDDCLSKARNDVEALSAK